MLIKESLFLSFRFFLLEVNCQEKFKINFPLLNQEKIEWKLTGFYAPVNGKRAIKSVNWLN